MNIAIYTFNSSIDTLPRFNDGYSYTYTDVDNGDGTITRTIVSDSSPTSISFREKAGLVSLSYLDTSNITSMRNMFYQCTNLTSLDLTGFNTSKVTSMSEMFCGCSSLTSLDLSSFNTSKVNTMNLMFQNCYKLTSINLSNFNTSNVNNMSHMFDNCNKLTSLDLSNFDTSKVTNMDYMFFGCNKLTTLDLNNFNTSKVTSMDYMLLSCNNLVSVNMYNSNVTSINKIINVLPTRTANSPGTLKTGITQMRNCNIAAANEKYWDIKSNTIVKYRFDTAKNSDYIPAFDSNFNNYYYIEDEDEGNGIILRTIKTTVDDKRPTQMKFGDKNNYVSNHALLEILEIDTSSLTTMSEMFSYCLGLTSLSILSSFNTSNVTDMSHMFHGIPNNLAIGDYIRDWDTSKVTNMSYMFSQCSKLTSLDVSKWDVSKVINMNSMFIGCAALTSLDVSNWRVPNVEDMSHMFYGCTNLTSLDVSNWDVSKVYHMYRMFYLCNKLTELDLSSWHTPFLGSMGEMFSYCDNLTKLNLCNWDLTFYQLQGESILYNVDSVIKEIDLSNCSLTTVNKIIQMLPSKKFYGSAGGLSVSEDVAKQIDNNALIESKNWSVIKTLIAEYVFDTNIDTRPKFNSINSGGGDYSYWYTYEDTLNADSTTRKIYTYNVVMPTSISFTDCEGLLSVQYLNTSNLKDMYGMFSRCTNLLSVNASDWDTSKVTNMTYAFRSCNKLTILDIANWDVSNVTRVYAMFQECSGLTSLDLSNWDVCKVTDMSYMFYQCYSLMSLSLKYWNTKSVTKMYAMFRECSKLTSLDLSSFSTYNVTDMGSMFDSCESLTTLYLNNWNTNKVTSIANLIYNSKKLNYVNVINSDENTVRTIQNYLPEKANLGDGALIIGDHIKRGITNSKNWKVFKQTVKKNTFTSSMLKYLLNSLKNKFALKSEVEEKVDKVENKVLSTNDYTNDDYERCKNILSNIKLSYKSSTGLNYESYRTDMVLAFNNLNEEYYTSILITPDKTHSCEIEIKDINKIKFTNINGIEFLPTLVHIEEDGPYITYYYAYDDLNIAIALNTEAKSFSADILKPVLLDSESNSRAANINPIYIHIPKVVMVEIPFDKHRPSGLIVGCDTNFVCEPGNEYRIYYKYASSVPYLYSSGKPYGEHTLVVETTKVEDPNVSDITETVLNFTDKLDSFIENENGLYTMDILSLQGLNENRIEKVTMIFNNESIVAERMLTEKEIVYAIDTPDLVLGLIYYIEEDKWEFGHYTSLAIDELSVIIEQKNKYVIKEELKYDYKDIPGYYSYIPNEKDTNITMYFISVNGIETGKTYLKPVFKNFMLIYEFNTGQALPVFNSGFTNYIYNDKTKTNSIERTLTSNSIPSSVSFNNNQNLTKMIYMSGHISNISNVFNNCRNLIESKVYGNQITNMVDTYCNCRNLKSSPACGPNVTNMWGTYAYCHNLTGSPTSGDKVTDMTATYWNCYNLTGEPVCGNNVTTMYQTYYGCRNITGSPVCGPNVKDMTHAYDNCSNLTGSPICGNKVTNMYYTYSNCTNIGSNGYFYSNEVYSVKNCFEGKNNNRRLNLYVPANSNTLTTCLCNNTYSLIGNTIAWEYANTEYDPYYVNTIQNIYVYPVENVAETYDQHKRLIVSYVAKNSSILPSTITTTYGNAGYTKNVVGNKITLLRTDVNAKVSYVSFNNNKNIYSILSVSDTITSMYNTFNNCTNLTGSPVCGDNVINMIRTYWNCSNLTGNPVCELKVKDMSYTYYNCNRITGSPMCGPNVTTMLQTYYNCRNLTGSPVCGNRVTDMNTTYLDCRNLTGSPVCGPNVVNMEHAYQECINLTGSPACGDNVTNMLYTYWNCSNLTGNPVCGNNVTDMRSTYQNCYNIIGSPVCGNNVKDMYGTYWNCYNLTGSPICGNNVTTMALTYTNCYNLTGSPVYGNNVKDMYCTYSNCYNLTGSPVCGDNVTNFAETYAYCNGLTGEPVCGPNVTDMKDTYIKCYNLTGSPVCGPNVTRMYETYIYCNNLTGSPVCGNNVTDMFRTYSCCYNLTGSPVCGPNVTTMQEAYYNCRNLTGSPVCGPNVTDMNLAYSNCSNLTGKPVCGSNVTNINRAYQNCVNLTGPVFVGQSVYYMPNAFYGCNNITGCNVYIASESVFDVSNSFYSSKSLNIYVPANSRTLNTISTYNSYGIKGAVWWDWINAENCYYNNTYDFRLIPINNVIQIYKENELGIVTYTTTNTSERPSSITGAVNGYGASINGNNVKLYKYEENDIITYMSFKNSQTITNVTSMTDSITNMGESFYNCRNLIKVPVCGNNVTTMAKAYYNCINLTDIAIGGHNVSDMSQAYYNCKNIKTNAYFFSNKINNAQSCFASKDTSKRLNIYVPQTGYASNYNTANTCLLANEKSLIGSNITWTNSIATNGCYYNTAQNIYIYPVDDVYQPYKENELLIAKYTVTNSASAFLPVYDKEKTMYHAFETGGSQPWYSDYTEVRYDFLKYNFDAFVSLKIDDTTTENRFYREITRQEMLNNPDGVVYENSLAKIVVLNDNGTIVLKITPYDWANVRFCTSLYYKVGYDYKNKYTVEDITNDDNTITRSVYIKDHNDHPPYLDFRGKVGLKSIDVLKINTPENTSHMFEGCTNLEYVNLSELDLNKIKIADYMFADCSKLTKESFDKLELPNIESAASIFRNCPNLQ